MKPSTLSMRLLKLTFAVVLFAAPAMARDIAQRQVRQQERVAQGVESGSLNANEAARIERQEARLHREVVRSRADGAGLNAAERARIDRQQDRLSREIARDKHNGR